MKFLPFLPKSLAGVFAASALLYSTSSQAAEDNAEEEGFEGAPTWSIFVPQESTSKNCQFTIGPDAPHGGASCAVLSSSDYARYGVSPKTPVAVSPGERWRLVLWLRGDGTTHTQNGSPGFVIRLLLLKDGKEVPGAPAIYVGMNSKSSIQTPADGPDFSAFDTPFPKNWTKIEAVFEIPKNLGEINGLIGPSLFAWKAKGSIFIDDVSLQKVPAETPLTPVVTFAPDHEGPLTTNEAALAALNLNAPGMEKVKEVAQSGNWDAIKQAYLDYRRHACPTQWILKPEDKPATPTATSDPIGDEICDHYIRNRYSFEPKGANMGKDFNWTFNPVPRNSPSYTDEWTFCGISRTQFWEPLADAYWTTGNEKYAKEWVAQLEDFARKNPMDAKPTKSRSSLWRTLDASERMDESWPYAYYHFLASDAFTPDAQWTYLKLICDHAELLRKGLEVPGRTGNWVLSECYGLYTIGVLFPELKDSEAWRKLAMDRLSTELASVVPDDGFEAELTPTYHYFSVSSFIGPLQLAVLNHLPVPASFHDKILAMYRAPVLVMDQSGNLVPTNDSGPASAAAKAREGLRFLGDDPLLKWAASKGKEGQAPPTSTMLPNAGFYAMRGGWNRNDAFLFFRGGPTGILHEHEDMLEVVLRAWNKTLLSDPGTATYDHSDWRRFIIGTASHNTIIVDGKWQHRGRNQLPAPALANPWITTPLFDYVSATYDKGYQQSVYDGNRAFSPQNWVGTPDLSVSHTRRVLFLKPYAALILDTLDGSGNHTFDAHFHVNDASASVDPKTQSVLSKGDDGAHLALYPLETDHLATDVVQGQKEPLLGWLTQQKPAPTVRFRKQQDAPATFATFLYPFAKEPPTFSFQILPVDGSSLWSKTLHTAQEDAEIVIAKDNRPTQIKFSSPWLGPITSQAGVLLVRKPVSGKDVFQGAWDLTQWQDQTWTFSSAEPVSLTWIESPARMIVFNAGTHAATLTVAKPFAQTVTLPAAAWSEVTKDGIKPATEPALFPPLLSAQSSRPSYQDYLKAQPKANATAPSAPPIRIAAATMTLPAGAVTKSKIGAEKAVVGWDEAGGLMSTRVTVPAAGWYRLKLRYCTPGEPSRTVLLNGNVPFAEAEKLTLASTEGAPPSDGWSNNTSDWKEISLGEDTQPGGWKFFLPAGSLELALRNDGGGGSNLDWVELDPVTE